MTSTAIVMDGSIVEGGAAEVVLEAASTLNADIFIGYSETPGWWTEHAPRDATILGGVPRLIPRDIAAAKRIHQLNLDGYQTVLTSGPPAKFYQPSDGQRWIHYAHHPSVPYQLRNTGRLVKYPLQLVDTIETRAVPELIANSELTADRLEQYYARRPDRVIWPPVRVDEMAPHPGDGSFVLVGRLCERKRTETVVKAFAGTDLELHVVGDGPLRSRIEAAATDNITIHGYLSRDRLINRVERSSYGVFLAQREDFGITPIELLAAGLPVLAVNEPNTNNQITDGVSGGLVEPSHTAVADAAGEMDDRVWDREAIQLDAQKYSVERFRSELRDYVHTSHSSNNQLTEEAYA